MAVGSKSFPQDNAVAVVMGSRPTVNAIAGGKLLLWAEILAVFIMLEAVLWTPRGRGHGVLIAIVVGSVLWLCFRRHSPAELGLVWPARSGTTRILAIGGLVAIALPLGAVLTGYPVPANQDWPRFQNLWPYVIWAVCQQFLLQSFFYLRLESLLARRWALVGSTFLFTIAHLPNLALTTMTIVGAVFFTEMFRRYRSIYPLGIVHAMLGISIAYTFADNVMHHMRVGLGFWQFR